MINNKTTREDRKRKPMITTLPEAKAEALETAKKAHIEKRAYNIIVAIAEIAYLQGEKFQIEEAKKRLDELKKLMISPIKNNIK